MTVLFPPSRAQALQRLDDFVPHAAHLYTTGRNTDNGPEGENYVSMLSPYLRHRLLTEREIVAAVLTRHNLAAAEKYVQEVMWRTYWKGWLEMRPQVWSRFVTDRDRAAETFPNARAIVSAENGMTGIEGFDEWARELVQTGYLHNHARMWFASIWIFTLRLPWTLGADFFLRHLIDADAASNTLSWRWVAGLQTAGKTYLASADNIARYTGGRFAPQGLAKQAAALTEAPMEPAAQITAPHPYDPAKPALLLVTHEDMNPETVIAKTAVINAAIVATPQDLLWGTTSQQFINGSAADTTARVKTHFGCDSNVVQALDADTLIAAAQATGAAQIVTPYAPVGPVADVLRTAAPSLAQAGLTLSQPRRSWDTQFWPHAKKGFFPFKEQIASGLKAEGIRV